MDRETWQAQNLKAIRARLQAVREKGDGVLYFEPAGIHFIIVTKQKQRLRLGLLEQTKPRSDLTQSWLHVEDPLYLPAFYSQAAILGLIWPQQVKRAYVIGVGGGRVPMVLHHHLPEALIECADIDPVMVDVAVKFFGIQFDDRLTVAIQDGREYLAQRQPELRYDLIVVDVFLGNGYTPYRLATEEFYRLCQTHLSEDGVVVVNMLDSDPFYAEKIKTILSVFRHIYLCVVAGNTVVFATHSRPLDETELLQRAQELDDYHRFEFPFMNRAVQLKTGDAVLAHVPDLNEVKAFRDDVPPATYFEYLPSFSTAFSTVDSNHPCPCGSGQPFEHCHGQPQIEE